MKSHESQDPCFFDTLIRQKPPDDADREVRERIDLLKQDGGFVGNPAHDVQGHSPVENVLAMFKTIRDSALS